MGERCVRIFRVLVLITVLWKPAYSNDECSIVCKGSPQSQQFAPGQKYNYRMEGSVSVFLNGSDKQETSEKLLGQVSVTAIGNCAHELTVQNLVISESDGKKYQSPPGIEKPIQFSLQDGRLGAEICVQEEDTPRSLNVKRSIISLLQTETKSSTQNDIFGACPTEVSLSQEGGVVLVHRSRDLLRCARPEQGNNHTASVFNNSREFVESIYIQSSQNVDSKVNNSIPEEISAAEEYLYRPFTVGDNGARSKVHTKLTLTGKSAGGAQGNCTVPRSIIFEDPHEDVDASNNAQNARRVVRETKTDSSTEDSANNVNLEHLAPLFENQRNQEAPKVIQKTLLIDKYSAYNILLIS